MTSTNTLRPGQLAKLLAATIPARLPVMITGAPGVGKSDVVTQAAAAAGARLILSHPVTSDPTDYKGLPFPSQDKTRADFLPFGDLAELTRADSPTVFFLDDLGQAPASVQAAAMQLILARQVNGHKVSDQVVFIAATNRRQDRAGVSGILEPVKSRFAAIVELAPTVDDWCAWAIPAGVPAEVVAYIRFRPDNLQDFKPSPDMNNSPSPRTWAQCGKLVALGLPADLEYSAYAGAIGEGAAAEFLGFLRVFRDLPSIDSVLLAPDRAPIPGNVSALYAISTALASRANLNNIGRILTYAGRLLDDGKGEFAALLMRDAYRRDLSITSAPEFTAAAVGPLGALISGTD